MLDGLAVFFFVFGSVLHCAGWPGSLLLVLGGLQVFILVSGVLAILFSIVLVAKQSSFLCRVAGQSSSCLLLCVCNKE